MMLRSTSWKRDSEVPPIFSTLIMRGSRERVDGVGRRAPLWRGRIILHAGPEPMRLRAPPASVAERPYDRSGSRQPHRPPQPREPEHLQRVARREPGVLCVLLREPAGETRWEACGEGGLLHDHHAWRRLGHDPGFD